MDLLSYFKTVQKGLKEKLQLSLLFVLAYAVLCIIFNTIFLILTPALGLKITAFVFLGLSVFLSYALFSTITKKTMNASIYFIVKKVFNYFVLFQFLFSSVILVSWKISEIIDFPLYYVFYALLVLFTLLHAPSYFALRNKNNLLKAGLLIKEKKGKKIKFKSIVPFKGPVFIAFDWIDAFVWAIVLIIFVNSLFLQIYRIPSESMVPSMYVEDRVVVLKALANPEIPLSYVHLENVSGVNRFSTVVMNNPRHTYTKEQVLNDFFSNVLFMMSFSFIQTPKVDINGKIIVEPLVKRVIALPGEKVMMVDDKVYIKKSDGEYKQLTDDLKYSFTALNNGIERNENKIKNKIPLDFLKSLTLWDAEKNAINYDAYDTEAEKFLNRIKNVNFKLYADLDALSNTKTMKTSEIENLFIHTSSYLVKGNSFSVDYAAHLKAYLLNKGDYIKILEKFLFSYKNNLSKIDNLYEENALKANLLFKIKFFGALEAYFYSVSENGIQNASTNSTFETLNKVLVSYTDSYFYLYDRRNFAPFPEGNGYIPKDEFFMMGDNRYNSLDCRTYKEDGIDLKPVSKIDEYSLLYYATNSLFSVQKSKLKGVYLFKFGI